MAANTSVLHQQHDKDDRFAAMAPIKYSNFVRFSRTVAAGVLSQLIGLENNRQNSRQKIFIYFFSLLHLLLREEVLPIHINFDAYISLIIFG